MSTLADGTVFELTQAELDALPFGVITLDRRGKILRYNRAEEKIAQRSSLTTVGLDFFNDVAPCTNVQAFRGRFDAFAQCDDSGAESFDFSFNFRWGRHDVTIIMLRKAAREEINIMVQGRSLAGAATAEAGAPMQPASQSALTTECSPPIYAGVRQLPAHRTFRLGSPQDDAQRRTMHPDDVAAVTDVLTSAARAKTSYAMEYRSLRIDGSVAIVHEYGSFDDGSDAAGFATLVDVSTRRAREETYWRAANYDVLTGLPNRNLMQQRIITAAFEAEMNHELAAVFVVNVDKFRAVNDTFGHEIGNRLLGMLALRFGECIRGGDAVAALGGDWFAVLLAGIDTDVSISHIASRLTSAISRPFMIEDRPFHITASVGISVAPYDGREPYALLRAADTAMRVAKNAGGNGFRYYHSEMSTEAAAKVHLHYELRRALERNEFELHFQPLVDITANRVVAAESLVRWNHPVRGMVPPSEFIDLADRTGLIVPLGEWILREACRQARSWTSDEGDVRVCVNISAVQFRQPNFVGLVASCLEEFELAPHRLELELTESVMVEGFGEMMQTLSQLKSLGVRLAIDDFGTGYSSLAYLKYFPVDTLKIDRAFIKEIGDDTFDRVIAMTILTLANELGLDCVVEGVETAEQCDVMRELGCTIVQGFFFSRPVSGDRLRALLGKQLTALPG